MESLHGLPHVEAVEQGGCSGRNNHRTTGSQLGT